MEQRNLLSTRARGALTPDAIAGLFAAGALHRETGRRLGEGDLSPDIVPTPAAVLVALVARDEGLSVLLTQRTAHLAHHPGQVSFPGGRLDPEDGGDPVVCALRESQEEVGLSPDGVAVLGRLDDYLTGTGFVVTPVVGLVRSPQPYIPDPFEVAEVFEVPLAILADPASYRRDYREVRGSRRQFWVTEWQDKVIWGATAGILVHFAEVLARISDSGA